MSININLEPNLSLQDVVTAQQEGYSVMRSAHVGNLRGYNLAVASLGIPVLLVDHNVVAQYPDDFGDRNYLPGSIVRRDSITPLPVNRLGGLAMQTTTQDGQYLDQLHIASLQQAFANTSFFTNTSYVRSQESISGEIAKIALTTMPELFKRVVESDGSIQQATEAKRNYAFLADSYGILQLNDDPRQERGLLLPNEVDILNNFVVEALRSGRSRQLHLSGPDMKDYAMTTNLRDILNRLYKEVLELASFRRSLPEDIQVDLIPAAEARFASSRSQTRQLYTIFDYLSYEDRVKEEKSAFFQSPNRQDDAQRDEFLAQIKTKEALVIDGLNLAVAEAKELFNGPRQAPFTSQYDVINEGGLVMPGQNTHLSLENLRKLTKRLTKRFSGKLP